MALRERELTIRSLHSTNRVILQKLQETVLHHGECNPRAETIVVLQACVRCAEVRRDGPRAQLGAVSAAADDYVATTSPLQSAEPVAEDADAGEAERTSRMWRARTVGLCHKMIASPTRQCRRPRSTRGGPASPPLKNTVKGLADSHLTTGCRAAYPRRERPAEVLKMGAARSRREPARRQL